MLQGLGSNVGGTAVNKEDQPIKKQQWLRISIYTGILLGTITPGTSTLATLSTTVIP